LDLSGRFLDSLKVVIFGGFVIKTSMMSAQMPDQKHHKCRIKNTTNAGSDPCYKVLLFFVVVCDKMET